MPLDGRLDGLASLLDVEVDELGKSLWVDVELFGYLPSPDLTIQHIHDDLDVGEEDLGVCGPWVQTNHLFRSGLDGELLWLVLGDRVDSPIMELVDELGAAGGYN